MSDFKQVHLAPTLVASNSTTAFAVPAGPAMRTAGIGKARADAEICGLNGTLNIAIGIQTSDDAITWTDETGTFAMAYGAASGVVHSTSVADFSSIAGAKQWLRPCYYVKLSAGSALATAFIQGTIDFIPRT